MEHRGERTKRLTAGAFLARVASDGDSAVVALQSRAAQLAPRTCREEGLDKSLAGDLADEVALRAMIRGWAALRRLSVDAPLDAWIASCLTRTAREMRRSERRMQGYGIVQPAESEAADDGDDENEELKALRLADQMTPELWAALTDRQTEAFQLAAQSLDVPEIARRLGISGAAARDRLARGAQRIKARMQGDADASARRPLPDGQPTAGPPLSKRQILARDLWNAGLSLAEIGSRLGCTAAGARSIIRRIRARLEAGDAR